MQQIQAVLSLTGGVIFFLLALPLLIVLALVLFVFSGWPIVFRQRRIGLGGKPFVLYKFRTMVLGAEKMKRRVGYLNEATGPVFKIRDDPRYTPIGKFLSHIGLDELPQLCNVLAGDMALIGPRPLPVAEAAKLASWMRKRHDILPGIISPWVLEGHNHGDFDAWMRSDIAYVKAKSPPYDGKLFIQTVVFLIKLFFTEVVHHIR
ncbi:sugar transferase [Candidatus Gottesmanbacteria bacterium]|nr:sugar transferase [Candidatus Gottesmanbacteria bacterium]